MPKIPISMFKTRTSLDVPRTPTRSISSAGMVEEARGNFGAKAGDFVATILKKREQSKTDDYISNEQVDLKLKYQEALANDLGPIEGKTDRVRAQMEEYRDRRANEAPSTGAGEAYSKYANNYLATKLSTHLAKENLQLEKIRRENISTNTSKLAFAAYEMPDPDQTLLDTEEHILSIKSRVGKNLAPEEAVLLEAQAREKVSQGIVYGLMEKGDFSRARYLVDSNYLGAYKDPKKANNIKTVIRSRWLEHERLVQSQEDRMEKEIKKSTEDRNFKTILDLQQKVIEGSLTPEQARLKLFKSIPRNAFSRKTLDNMNFVSRVHATPIMKARSDEIKNNFVKRLVDAQTTDDLEGIKKDVLASKNLLSDHSNYLLLNIEGRFKSFNKSSDQVRIRKLNESRLRNLINPLEAKIPEIVQSESNALLEYNNRVNSGENPDKAFKEVARQYKGGMASYGYIPGIPTEWQNNPVKYKDQIENMIADFYKSKRFKTLQEVDKWRKLLEDRISGYEIDNFKPEGNTNEPGNNLRSR